MRLILIILLLFNIGLIGCSTTKNQDDVIENPPGTAQDDFGDTSEKDLSGKEGAAQPEVKPKAETDAQTDATAEPPPVDAENKEASNPPDQQPPADNMTVTPTNGENAAGAVDIPTGGKPARVTALDFNANLNGGTVILKTNRPVAYTTRKNEGTNQFVIELQNTVVPSRFKRPYNTKEFSGPIGSINAYQTKGANNTARVVIQLKTAIEPSVVQNGKVINIAGSGGAAPAQDSTVAQESENSNSSDEDTSGATEANSEGDGTSAEAPKDEVAQMPSGEKAMNDFLTGNAKYYGRPISLEVKDADIRDVFKLIAEESGVNLLIQDDVVGKISLKLRKIPWDQALTVILQSKQLGYVKQGNILRIAPLRAIQAETDAAKKVIDSEKDLLPLRVKLFPVSYAVASDLEPQVKDFLSSRGKARADKRTNLLVVTDIDEVIAKVKTLVARLDTQTPQVLIEAKVVEARESFQRIIGVNWNFTGATSNIGLNSQGNQSTLKPTFNSSPGGQSQIGLNTGFTLGSLDFFGDLTASLSLLEVEKLVKIISSPRIVTLDRQEAKIEQTTSFPLFNSTVTPTGGIQGQTTTQDVKLELTVKPQISADGGIIMDVNITREFPDAAVVGPGGATALPINKRHAQTKVLVENGDTVVIGGIYQSDVTESENGVPFLRKLPIIGALFRQRNVDREKNELVIFLTPRILNREKAFAKMEAN